jgi:hypothetical protein
MKNLTLAIAALVFGQLALADPVTFQDPYPGSSCANPSCDVIGSNALFDIDKIIFQGITGNQAKFDIYTSFLGGASLTPTSFGGSILYLGDLLFTQGTGIVYGVALTAHAGSGNNGAVSGGIALTQGGLYAVNNSFGILSSNQVMGTTNNIYRQNKPVWLFDNGESSVSQLGTGSVSVSTLNNVATSLLITVLIPTNNSFGTFLNDGDWGLSFASATCANDILEGRYTEGQEPIPEPSTYLLMSAGLIGLGLLRRRR